MDLHLDTLYGSQLGERQVLLCRLDADDLIITCLGRAIQQALIQYNQSADSCTCKYILYLQTRSVRSYLITRTGGEEVCVGPSRRCPQENVTIRLTGGRL